MILVHKAKTMSVPLPLLHPIKGCAEPSLENNFKFIQNIFVRIENTSFSSFFHEALLKELQSFSNTCSRSVFQI